MAAPLKRAVETLPASEVTRLRELLATALVPYREGDRLRIPATPVCAAARI